MSDDIMIILIKTMLVLAPLSLICVIYGWIYNQKLVSYLKKHDPWRYQNIYGDFLQGYIDPFSSLPKMLNFLYTDEDEDDEIISKYRENARKGLLLGFVIFLVIMFLGVTITLIAPTM